MKRAFLAVVVVPCMCGCLALTPEQIALNRGLYEGAKRGDVAAVRAGIASGAQLESRHTSDWNDLLACQPTFGEWTPLHGATYYNRKEVVTILLDAGADVDARDGWRKTALHWGAKKGHKEVVRILIDRGADLNPKSRLQTRAASPLWTALQSGHGDVALLLRQSGGRLTAFEQQNIDQALYGSAIAGDAERLEILLSQGATIGSAPIHRVANRGNVRVLEVLLDAGGSVNALGTAGETLLHQAAGGGSREVVKLLLSRGADINAKDKRGHVPFLWAMYNGKRDIIRLLLEEGADANARDKRGSSLLQHAIGSNRSDIAELLRQYGAQE